MSLNLRYDVGNRTLGRGGSGLVTLGKDQISGSPVAVKTVSRKQFEQHEVDMMRTLDIPHSIRYRHDFEVINQTNPEETNHYIVMDFVNGYNVSIFYKHTHKTFPLTEIRSAAFQLLEYLAKIEKKNIVYIDLKPNNIIWQQACRHLTVVDLGAAHEIKKADSSKTGATSVYAPPDFLLGKPFTHGFDLWSAGVTFYYMICGKKLFNLIPNLNVDETYKFVLQQIVEQIGAPSSKYLQDCQRSGMCFDQDRQLKMTWPSDQPFVRWQDSFKEGLEKLGATEAEKAQWLDLMTSLLSYENRGSAQEHLKRALFQSEMQVFLEYDPKCRCKMYIHRLELLGAPIESVNLADIKVFDYEADFKIDKHRCIHLPDSTTGEYAIFVELNGEHVAATTTLQKGDLLDIKEMQKWVVKQAKGVLIEDEGEPEQKKSKPDDAE